MEIIHDITILIILGITLQFIESVIVHREEQWYTSQLKLITKQFNYFYLCLKIHKKNTYNTQKLK